MLRTLAASLVVMLGCSSQSQEDEPPVLEVTSPARGTFADSETVTVSGRVTDNGPVRVTVAGQEVTPAKDGTFTATVEVGNGIEIIETHAIDRAGNDVRDVRAVLAGSLGPTDGTQAAGIGARAGVTALRAVGNAIAVGAKAIDYNAAAKAANPIYNDTGCLGATVNITSVTLSNVGVALAPKAGALSTDVVIDNLVVKLAANFKVACFSGSTTITLRATKTKIHGDLGARISSEKLVTTLPTPTVTFEGFSLDASGVPSEIESLLRTQARDGVSTVLASTIRSKVPPLADKAIADLIAKPVNAQLLGRDMTITVSPSDVTVTPTELFVAVSSKLRVAGGEGGTFLQTPTTLDAAGMGSTQGLGVALDDDLINQLFAGLWAADALEQSVSTDTVPALGILLDDDARDMAITLSLPPTVSTDTGELVLSIGDMIVDVRDSAGAEVHRIAVSLTTTLAAEPSQSGRILLTVGAPTVYAQVVANSAAVEKPLTDEQVEALVAGAWGLIGVMADDALGKLPMPTIAGIQLGAPQLEAGNNLVFAEMSVSQ